MKKFMIFISIFCCSVAPINAKKNNVTYFLEKNKDGTYVRKACRKVKDNNGKKITLVTVVPELPKGYEERMESHTELVMRALKENKNELICGGFGLLALLAFQGLGGEQIHNQNIDCEQKDQKWQTMKKTTRLPKLVISSTLISGLTKSLEILSKGRHLVIVRKKENPKK